MARGRPVKHPLPEPIDATPEEVAQVVLRAKPKETFSRKNLGVTQTVIGSARVHRYISPFRLGLLVGCLARLAGSGSASQDATRLGGHCCARSTSTGLVDFVRHRVTPDESRPALPFAGWLKAEFVLHRALSHVARGGVGTSQGVCNALVLRLLNVTPISGERLQRSFRPDVASNRTAPNRGHETLPSMSGGVYSLVRLHDSWHARGYFGYG